MTANDVRRFRRPAFLDQVPRTGHGVVEASAGTGKTYALERLVVDELLRGTPLDAVLVLTFTDKASREMRARIRALLLRLDALDPGDEDVDPAEGPAWTLDPSARERIREALAGFDRAPIATIHAFCQRVLGDEAFASGHRLSTTLVDGRRVRSRALREELRRILAEPIPSGAPPDPLRGPLLAVLADRGQRLDELITAVDAWATEPGRLVGEVSDDALIAALRRLPDWGILERRIAAALARTMRRDVRQRCLDALAALGEVAQQARRPGVSPGEVREAFDAWARTPATRSTHQLPYLREKLAAAAGDPRGKALQGLASLLAEPGFRPSSPWAALLPGLLQRVEARAQAEKAGRGEVDFDDLVRRVREAVAPLPDDRAPSPLCRALRARYRVALVDEFQDTDALQWGIFEEVFFASREGHRLRLIGDPKQAIYGFRSADVHTYRRARDQVLGTPRAALVRLATSYRATPALLAATNELLADDFFTGSQEDAFVPLTPGRPGLRLEDGRGRPLPPVVVLRPAAPEGSLNAPEASRAIAQGIAQEVVALLARGVRWRDGSAVDRAGRPLNPGDIQVLTRTGEEAGTVAAALDAQGVPHGHLPRDGLFQGREAAELRDVLHALERPRHTARRLLALRTVWFGVPHRDLPAARALPPDHPLAERFDLLRRLGRAGDLPRFFRALTDGPGGPAPRLLRAGEAGARALAIHRRLTEVLLAEAQQGRLGLGELRRRLDDLIAGRALPLAGEDQQQAVPRTSEAGEAAVQVMTMHQAKGLEATVVFVFGGLFAPPGKPLAPAIYRDAEGRRAAWIGGEPPKPVRAAIAQEAREEDERLLYVALTRARGQLVLPFFGPLPGAGPGGAQGSVLSRTPTGIQGILERRLATLLPGKTVGRPSPGRDGGDHAAEEEEDPSAWAMRSVPVPDPSLPEDATVLRRGTPAASGPGTGARPVGNGARGPDGAADPSAPALRAAAEAAQAVPREELTALAEGRRGFSIVSYSGLKAAAESKAAGAMAPWEHPDAALRDPFAGEVVDAPELVALDVDEETRGDLPDPEPGADHAEEADQAQGADPAGPAPPAGAAPDPPDPRDELPGGTAVGLFLHDVLEHADRGLVEAAADPEAWLRAPGVVDAFRSAAARNGVDPRHIPAASRLAFAGLRAPLELDPPVGEIDGDPTGADGSPSVRLPRGLAGVTQAIPEMRLLYPRPHPNDGDQGAGTAPSDLVRGILDLVFQVGDRVFVLDWKSDRLPSYEPTALRAHVEASYRLQADLYTLGILRMLRLGGGPETAAGTAPPRVRFGGLLYAFLRGMRPDDGRAGVHLERPDEAALAGLEARVAARLDGAPAGPGGGDRRQGEAE
jgi:exodeoxyribonuclease V beta subunit